MFKNTWNFIKRLGGAIYDNVIAPVVTLCKHILSGEVEQSDEKAMMRVVSWGMLVAILTFASGWTIVIGLLMNLCLFDVIWSIGKSFMDLAKIYQNE